MKYARPVVPLLLVAALSACASGNKDESGSSVSSAPSSSVSSAPSVTASSETSASASPTPTQPVRINPEDVDVSDPDAVADAFAVTAVVRDARTDTSSTDAQARASQWCVPSLAVTEGAELERPDGEWTAMQEHEAYDVVDGIDRTIDDPVPDTTTAYRMRTVTTHAEAEDGWRGQTRTTQLWITLEQSPEGAWQVSAVTSRVEEGEPA